MSYSSTLNDMRSWRREIENNWRLQTYSNTIVQLRKVKGEMLDPRPCTWSSHSLTIQSLTLFTPSSGDSEMIIFMHNFLARPASQWLRFDYCCLWFVLLFNFCFGLDFCFNLDFGFGLDFLAILMFWLVKYLGFVELSFGSSFELIPVNLWI